MSLITDVKMIDENNCSFKLNDIDKSLVNALRRTIMSDIPTFKFRTEPYEKNDVKIFKNTCALHNEFLTHRIGMIPVYIEDPDSFDPSRYYFRINKKNDTESIVDVTTEDINVFYLDDSQEEKEIESSKFFKPNEITNEYIVITKLKPDQFGNDNGEELQLEAKLSIGTGKENAGYSPVSKVVFFNSVDEKEVKNEIKRILAEREVTEKLSNEQKQRIKRSFENFEAYRHFHKDKNGHPNKFNFEIESIGALSVYQIMNNALDIIEKNINYFNMVIDSENDDIEINESLTVMEAIDIIIKGHGHTLGNILQSYLFRNFVEEGDKLQFVGYKIPHPLKKELVLRIKINTEEQDFEKRKEILKNIIHENTEKLNSILSTLRKEWNSQIKDTSQHLKDNDSGPAPLDSSSTSSKEKIIIKKKKKSSNSSN